MEINNGQRDARGGGASQNEGGRGLSEERVKTTKATMEGHARDEDDLERTESEKERKGWDLKF